MTKEQWEKGVVIGGVSVPAKCPLFTIEILFQPFYDFDGNPAKKTERWNVYNHCWPEVRSFRETLFTHGFFLERTPGRGEIIFPADFRKILIDIQPKGFKETV